MVLTLLKLFTINTLPLLAGGTPTERISEETAASIVYR